jgi:hypothetical protein
MPCATGRFTRAVSFEDGRALWEAKRWPRTIAGASADALAYLDLLLEQLAGSLTSEKAAFEAALATYPDKVCKGLLHGEGGGGMVHGLLQTTPPDHPRVDGG